jgi:hypothetical protein
VIDAGGRTGYILDPDPGSDNASIRSSFAGVIVDNERQAHAAT